MNITSRNINSRALVIVTVEINPNMYEMRQQVTKYNPMKKSQRHNHILTPISITAQDTKQNTFVPSSPCQRRLEINYPLRYKQCTPCHCHPASIREKRQPIYKEINPEPRGRVIDRLRQVEDNSLPSRQLFCKNGTYATITMHDYNDQINSKRSPSN